MVGKTAAAVVEKGLQSSIVHVIDDDEDLRDLIREMLTESGCRVETYASALDFLAATGPQSPACVVTDVRLPGMTGLELLAKLSEADAPPPAILMSGAADVPMAVGAMKLGAVDVLQKPFGPHELVTAVEEALSRTKPDSSVDHQYDKAPFDLSGLSDREVEVLRLFGFGLSDKEIARELGVSDRTVESHRAKIKRKTGARNIADLHRAAAKLSRRSGGS